MADVEMSDAPGGTGVKKADGANGKSVEAKKKFEVKKVLPNQEAESTYYRNSY